MLGVWTHGLPSVGFTARGYWTQSLQPDADAGRMGLFSEGFLLLGGFLVLLGFFDFAFADFVAFAHEGLLLGWRLKSI
jgi:hypothetical protein